MSTSATEENPSAAEKRDSDSIDLLTMPPRSFESDHSEALELCEAIDYCEADSLPLSFQKLAKIVRRNSLTKPLIDTHPAFAPSVTNPQCVRTAPIRTQTPQGNPFDPCDAILVCDHVYLGCVLSSQDRVRLLGLNVGYIINCTKQLPQAFENDFTYMRLEVDDADHEDISCYFDAASAFIEGARSKNKNVFVHCMQGMSRSATIILAWLLRYKRMSLNNAYWMAKGRRHCLSPNPGFIRQLASYEATIFHGDCSFDTEAYAKGRFGSYWPEEMLDLTCTHAMYCHHNVDPSSGLVPPPF